MSAAHSEITEQVKATLQRALDVPSNIHSIVVKPDDATAGLEPGRLLAAEVDGVLDVDATGWALPKVLIDALTNIIYNEYSKGAFGSAPMIIVIQNTLQEQQGDDNERSG